MESLVQCLEGWLFSCSRKLYILFPISFLIFWNSINLPMYHSLETRIWFRIIFLPVKKSLALFQIWVFCQPSIILSNLELSRINLPKLTSILMEIVTIPVVLVDEFCFNMHRPIKAFLKKLSLN